MQASAAFVSASALGMACGPAMAGLLQVNFKLYAFTVNAETLPGWVMAFGWFAYLIWLWISFQEPVLGETYEEVHRQVSSAGSSSTSKPCKIMILITILSMLIMISGVMTHSIPSYRAPQAPAEARRAWRQQPGGTSSEARRSRRHC
jgi:hypothetical protein